MNGFIQKILLYDMIKSLLNTSLAEVKSRIKGIGEKCPTPTCREWKVFTAFLFNTLVWLWSIGWIKFSENGIMILQPPRKAFIDVVKSFWIALVVQGLKKRNDKYV